MLQKIDLYAYAYKQNNQIISAIYETF